MPIFYRLAAALVMCVCAAGASAAVARLDVTGTVYVLNTGYTTMTATFLLDTATPNDFNTDQGGYYRAPTIEGSVAIGDNVYTARTFLGSNNLVIQNNSEQGTDGFGFQAEVESEDGDIGLFFLQLYDNSQTVFSNGAFPEFGLTPDDFNVSDADTATPTAFALFGFDRVQNQGYAFTDMNYTIVPLPAAGWLFASTLAGLGFLRRR